MDEECSLMSYNNIRIERERNGYEVCCTDPAIQKANDAREGGKTINSYKDPNVEFSFDTKAQVLKFLESALDIALPADEYTSEFDKLAKEAMT